jgi:hypothetical protein
VARQLTPEELEKAARNLERIEAYLVPRSRWTLDPAHLETVVSLRQLVARLRERFHPSGSARRQAPPRASREVADLDPAPLDTEQLTGFVGFLDRLDRWLEASAAVPPATGATELVARIESSLEASGHALATIAGTPKPAAAHATPAAPAAIAQPDRPASDQPATPPPPARRASVPPATAAPPPRAAAGRSTGPAAAVDDVFAGAPRPRQPGVPVPVEQIALTASEADPMFRWVGSDDVELTPRARERIEQLFAAQGITFFRYQLENFASEVRRRIRTAPEGHVLVIKVRDIGGERKPFLSYMPAKMFTDD